jgi:predicted transcriptional regulator
MNIIPMKLLLLFISGIMVCFQVVSQSSIEKAVQPILIKDADDNATPIPFLGEKVIAIFYNDPDAKDVNDPLSDAINAHQFPKEKFGGVGIANSADTWLPNTVIRYAVREKAKKYPGSIILIDENRILSKVWGVPNCNDNGCVLVIGADMKIKYINQISNQETSKACITAVIKTIETEIAKMN